MCRAALAAGGARTPRAARAPGGEVPAEVRAARAVVRAARLGAHGERLAHVQAARAQGVRVRLLLVRVLVRSLSCNLYSY